MSTTAVAERMEVKAARKKSNVSKLEVLLNAAATLQAVWFYLAYVHCYVDLAAYEAGVAHTPYQYRLLLMLPLRWAHGSAVCTAIAGALTHLHAWFPTGVRPESLVEFPVDVAAVAVAGLVTRRMYLAASRTGMLAAVVYPLTLVMVVGTYALGTVFRLRFVYDLPSLAFFAGGMFVLYVRRPLWEFALLFAVATLNRETTLFLLVLFVLSRAGVRRRWRLSVAEGLFAAGLTGNVVCVACMGGAPPLCGERDGKLEPGSAESAGTADSGVVAAACELLCLLWTAGGAVAQTAVGRCAAEMALGGAAVVRVHAAIWAVAGEPRVWGADSAGGVLRHAGCGGGAARPVAPQSFYCAVGLTHGGWLGITDLRVEPAPARRHLVPF